MVHSFHFRLLLLGLLLPVVSLRAQQYAYVGQVGENSYTIAVHMYTEQGNPVLVLEEDKRYSEHTFDPDLGTEKWVLRDSKDHHDFIAQRTGNQIRIQGTHQGEPIDKEVTIDERPWFNKLDHGLSDFAASDREEISFWALKLMSDLTPMEMKAEKEGTETVAVGGQTYDAVKVKLTIDSFLLSKLWSAELWYRASDGLFLRYEGVNGGPGTPETVIELEGQVH